MGWFCWVGNVGGRGKGRLQDRDVLMLVALLQLNTEQGAWLHQGAWDRQAVLLEPLKPQLLLLLDAYQVAAAG